MSTMPKYAEFRNYREYGEALEAWAQTTEGKEQIAEEERKKDEAGRSAQAAYESERLVAQNKYLEGMGIPTRALAAARGMVERTKAMEAAEGAVDFLVLSGGPGCGKTVAATSWIIAYVMEPNRWTRNGYHCDRPMILGVAPIWATAAKLARCDRYDEEAMTKLLKTPRLVIDDLGGEYLDKGGFYASLLDEIVNERQGESRPTILTTNLDADGFKSRYGERIADRIREGGRFIGCGKESLRRKSGL